MSVLASFLDERAEVLDYVPEDVIVKKVTLRLHEDAVEDLDFIAAKLGMSRTGCAEEVLARAIQETRQAVETHPYYASRNGSDPKLVGKVADEAEAKEAA